MFQKLYHRTRMSTPIRESLGKGTLKLGTEIWTFKIGEAYKFTNIFFFWLKHKCALIALDR
jgi:hypothetical protein